MSPSWLANYRVSWRLSLELCSVIQDTLCAKGGVPQETRDAMEELCRTMQSLIIEHQTSAFRPISNREATLAVDHAIRSAYTYLTKSRSTSEDVAESCKPYLLKCLSSLSLIIDNIVLMQIYCTYATDFSTPSWSALTSLNAFEMAWLYPTRVEDPSDKFPSFCVVHDFFVNPNILGWFLSIRGPDAEERITKLREAIDDAHFSNVTREYLKSPFSRAIEHRLGVTLVTPRHERLHFENDRLTKHPSTGTRSSEPPLTLEQRKRWTDAFETLSRNLWCVRSLTLHSLGCHWRSNRWNSSSESELRGISLDYFIICPLPYESDPMLNTTIALNHCGNLQSVISQIYPWERDSVSRAVSHIHTCITRRVEYVLRSCRDLGPDALPTFDNTPFDIPKVVNVLNDLAKLSQANILIFFTGFLSCS